MSTVQEPLRDRIGRVLYEEPGKEPRDWYCLSEERREPWRKDADRILEMMAERATVEESLTVRNIPRLSNCGAYYAKDNAGNLHFLNHANIWQACPSDSIDPPELQKKPDEFAFYCMRHGWFTNTGDTAAYCPDCELVCHARGLASETNMEGEPFS